MQPSREKLSCSPDCLPTPIASAVSEPRHGSMPTTSALDAISASSESFPFLGMPRDMCVYTLSLLELEDLSRARRTSHAVKDLIDGSDLWKRFADEVSLPPYLECTREDIVLWISCLRDQAPILRERLTNLAFARRMKTRYPDKMNPTISISTKDPHQVPNLPQVDLNELTQLRELSTFVRHQESMFLINLAQQLQAYLPEEKQIFEPEDGDLAHEEKILKFSDWWKENRAALTQVTDLAITLKADITNGHSITPGRWIPAPVYLLSNLTKLTVEPDRRFHIPREIKRFQQLKTLVIKPKQGPTSLYGLKNLLQLPKLEALSLEYCHSDEDLAPLGNISTLRTLNLTGSEVKDLPKELENLKQLSSLGLGATPLKTLPEVVQKLDKLTKLEVPLAVCIHELPHIIGPIEQLVTTVDSRSSSRRIHPSWLDLPFLDKFNVEDTHGTWIQLEASSLPPKSGKFSDLDHSQPIMIVQLRKLLSQESEPSLVASQWAHKQAVT